MKKCIVLLTCCLLLAVLFGAAYARENKNPRLRRYRPWTEGEFPEVVDPNFLDLKISAAVDTYNIVRYDFEQLDWQGWTQVDNTAQVDTFVHVDDFMGLGGGDFGRLYPLEGAKSMWCGVRPDAGDQYLCGWIYPPGYGNDWNQILACDSLAFTGLLTFSFKGAFDSEQGWDITYLEYDAGGGDWIAIEAYDDIHAAQIYTFQLFLAQPVTKLRFRFESDEAWSDQDGLYNTDGAFIVDSLVISDDTGVIDFETFETADVGDLTADGDGNGISWSAGIGESFGKNSGLMTNLCQDKDPCGVNYNTQVVFYISDDPHPNPGYPYPGLYDTPFCRGAGGIEPPCQNEMVVSPVIDLTRYSTGNDEIQDAEIPPGKLPNLRGLLLRYTIFRDLPLENLVFSFWHVRDVDETGCPGQWDDSGYWIPWNDGAYVFEANDISNLIEEDRMQVALGVEDMCQYWYLQYGNCANHTPAPWYDNIRIQRYYISGPQWSYRDLDLLQDEFPTEGLGIEAFVRADAASDLNSNVDPILRPGDSIVVTVRSLVGGGIKYTVDGWPMVYCHVRAKYIGCASSCPGHVHPKAAYLFGPSLAGTYGRYVSDDGSQWTKLQCAEARVGNWPGTPVPDVYMVDLNDSLFTRGYMIEYYFEAVDSADAVSYLPDDAPTKATLTYGSSGTVYDAVSYIFEMTCLPLGCSDILYVDDFHGRGTFWGTVEQYFTSSFVEVLYSTDWPERYDVNSPSSLVGNGLKRSATSTMLTCYYRTIIWDSGNLSNGTIGDGTPDSDKTNDCQLLVDWMTLYPDSIAGAGLWILGDDVAQDLAGLTSPQALALLTTWCGVLAHPDPDWGSYYDLTGGFPVGTVNPLITGTPDGIFYHIGTPDQWYVLGGCPIINQFDCLSPATGAVTAATYPDYGSHTGIGAAIQNVKLNASDAPIRTMWFGHSLMYMRSTEGGSHAIRWHIMEDVISWFNYGSGHYLDATVPKAYNLAQNFPNPFNPQTTIRFDVKERGHVSLKIYNVAGQLVKTLVDEVKDAASYTIRWDGTNNRGTKVASGVYFYKMQSKSFSQTRKMVVLK